MEEIDMNYGNKIGNPHSSISLDTQFLSFSVKITSSVYPVPSICRFDQLGDWFESLADILHWNLREPQLSFDSDRRDKRSSRDHTKGIDEDPNSNSSSNTSTSESSEDIQP